MNEASKPQDQWHICLHTQATLIDGEPRVFVRQLTDPLGKVSYSINDDRCALELVRHGFAVNEMVRLHETTDTLIETNVYRAAASRGCTSADHLTGYARCETSRQPK